MLARLSVIAALVLLVGGPLPAARQPAAPPPARADLEDMARRATERIRALQREADQLAARERTLLTELRQLALQRQIRAEELGRITIDLQRAGHELDAVAAEVRALESAVVTEEPDVAGRLVALYKFGRSRYARLLFDVDSSRAFARAYRLVAALAAIDRRRIEAHQARLDALRSTAATLAARRDEAAALQQEAARARAELDRAIARHTSLVRTIDSRRDLNAQLIGELQVAQQRLQAALADVAAGETPAAAPVALPLRTFRGVLAWPAPGAVATQFGRHRQSRFGTTIVRNGIDLATPAGSPVAAVHAGRVAFADAFTGFGNLVIVDHGAQAYTLYGYLESIRVTRGARVDAGTLVGTSGRSPIGTPALYFEVRIDGKPVDPLQWLEPR